MLKLNTVILFSEKPSDMVAFYKKVLGKDPEWSAGNFVGFGVGSTYLMIGPHDKVHGKSKEPERIIINFETPDVAGEFARVKDLGATVVAAPYQPGEDKSMWLATLADPDNNYFQLTSPMSK